MKKFLSNSLSAAAGFAAGDPLGVAVARAVVVVVVAGDMAVVVAGDMAVVVAGVVPARGEIAGAVAPGTTGFAPVTDAAGAGGTAGFTAAGLIAVVGGAPGARGAFGGAGTGVWPNEVSARVKEQRLAISSVFIGLIGKRSLTRISMSLLSSMR